MDFTVVHNYFSLLIWGKLEFNSYSNPKVNPMHSKEQMLIINNFFWSTNVCSCREFEFQIRAWKVDFEFQIRAWKVDFEVNILKISQP